MKLICALISILLFNGGILCYENYNLSKERSNSHFHRNNSFFSDVIKRKQIYIPDVNSVKFKSRLLNSLKEDPSKIAYIETIPQSVYELIVNKSQTSGEHIVPLLHNKDYKQFITGGLLPNDFITEKLNVNTNTVAGVIEANILRQYISPMLLAMEYLDKDEFFSDFANLLDIVSILNEIKFTSYDTTPRSPQEYYENIHQQIHKASLIAEKSEKIKKSDILSIAISLYLSIQQVNELTRKNLDFYRQHVKTTIIDTELGKIALGGFGNDNYSEDFLIIIDLGGNDTYLSNNNSIKNRLKSPISCIIDFSGDDIYIGNDFCFGGSAFGINILIDFEGNDSYSSGDFSLGSALFGVGILVDYYGDDIYSGRGFSIGSAYYGWGFFVDAQGNDIYRGTYFTQGSAYCTSMGILVDAAGNDNYIASQPYLNDKKNSLPYHNYSQGASLGFPYATAGGIGILYDASGDDNYIANNSSQGYANYYSIGALIDRNGNDRYQSGDNSQAFSEDFSFALLLDYFGNDVYTANTNAQAYSGGFSFSILFDDYSENDYFIRKMPDTDSKSIFATSLLIRKNVNSENIEISNPIYTIEFKHLNPFDDKDSKFPIPFNELFTKSSYIEKYPYKNDFSIKSFENLESLFSLLICINNDSTKFQEILKEFIDNNNSLQYIKNREKPSINIELRVLSKLLLAYPDRLKSHAKQIISNYLNSSNHIENLLGIHLTGLMKISDTANIINAFLANPDVAIKCIALWTLAQLNYKNSTQYIEMTHDSDKLTRLYAIYTLSKTDTQFFTENKVISETELSLPAFAGIRDTDYIEFSIILSILESNSAKEFKSLVATLANKSNISNKNAKNYKKRFRTLPDNFREEIYLSLIQSRSPALNILSDKCTDPVYKKISKSMRKQ